VSIIVNGQTKVLQVYAQTNQQILEIVNDMKDILILKVTKLYLKKAQEYGLIKSKTFELKEIKEIFTSIFGYTSEKIKNLLKQNNTIEGRIYIIYKIERIFSEEYFRSKLIINTYCINVKELFKSLKEDFKLLNNNDPIERPENSIFIKSHSYKSSEELPVEELEKINDSMTKNEETVLNQIDEIQALLQEIKKLDVEIKKLNEIKKTKGKGLNQNQKNRLIDLSRQKGKLNAERNDKKRQISELETNNQSLKTQNKLTKKFCKT